MPRKTTAPAKPDETIIDQQQLQDDFQQASQLAPALIEIDQKFSDGLPYDQNRIINECRFYMAQSAEAMLEAGKRLQRAGWNGKGMFVYFVPANSYPAQTGAAKAHFGENAMVPYNPYFAIKNVDNTVSTWVPSVNDCLAKDWHVIDIE